MKKTDAQTVVEKLKEAVYFSICYKPKKYNGRPVYRNAKWDDKCKIGNGYIIYYDRDRGGYRCASGESAISIGQGRVKQWLIIIGATVRVVIQHNKGPCARV